MTQDMSDDLNRSLDYLWEMLADKGLFMQANIVTLAQNRIEELEDKQDKLANAIPLLNRIKSHRAFRIEEVEDLIASLKGDKP